MTRHATDLVSLAFGLLFAAIGAVLLADQRLAISTDWLAPVVAIGLGAILIAAGARRRGAAE
jgi:cytochrome c-type biogenesis protein CcmH/NrfF